MEKKIACELCEQPLGPEECLMCAACAQNMEFNLRAEERAREEMAFNEELRARQKARRAVRRAR